MGVVPRLAVAPVALVFGAVEIDQLAVVAVNACITGAVAQEHPAAAVGQGLDALGRVAQVQVQALLSELALQVVADVRVEAGQHVVAAVDQVDLAAAAVEDAGELDPDVAGADDGHAKARGGREALTLLRGRRHAQRRPSGASESAPHAPSA